MKTSFESVKASVARDVVTSIIRKSTFINEQLSGRLKKHNITIQQFNVLRILRGRKGDAATLQDVSRDMIHSNSNTTRVIDKLIDKSLVNRTQCSEDRRQIRLTITEQGLYLLRTLDEEVDDVESTLTKDLTEYEMATIVSLLHKID
jgi:DNA-binding MarR family transcriptional regulator